MMKRALTAFLLLTIALQAESRPIKLGTIAPRDSSYHKILLRMGESWRASGVELKIYPGGFLGGEAEMVRRMKTGALDAAMLTVAGLSEIDDSVRALQNMPLLFRSLDEVDYIGVKLRPRLEKSLRARGFVVLFWGDAGWVRFFSKNPVLTPDDLRRTKLFTWAGDPDAVALYRSEGFHPLPLETNDIVTSLQTGLINAVPMPPYIALATQVYPLAPHMLEINWAPLCGALVVTEQAWDRLPSVQQAALARAAAQSGQEIQRRNRQESDEAVSAMKKRGLIVHPMTPELDALWRRETEAIYPRLRGRLVPADLFDEVRRLLEERRTQR
jgi:TRAP-type C4-dicarboxylate transport system substrate-binding protein